MNFLNKYGAGFVMGVSAPLSIMGWFFDIKEVQHVGWTLFGIGFLWLIIGLYLLYRKDSQPRCPHLHYDENSIEHEDHPAWAYCDGHREQVMVHCVYAKCLDCGNRFLYEAM